MQRSLLFPHWALVFTSASFFITANAADWPQYRGPAGNGISPEKLSPAAWPTNGLRELWRAPSPTGFSSFVVENGRAYTIVGQQVDGVPREVCVALDAATSKELWATPFGFARYDGGGGAGSQDNRGGDGPRSTPVVRDGRVFVYSSGLRLVCLDAKDGRELWAKDVVKDFAGKNIQWQSAMSPVLDDARVFVAGGGAGQSLLAFDQKSGEVAWKTQDDGITHATPVFATIHGQRQLLFLTQRGPVAVDPKDGTVLWRHDHPYRTSTGASPVVEGDIVYCSSAYGVGATTLRVNKSAEGFSTTLLWRKPNQLMNHWSTPVVKDGHLYGLFGQAPHGRGPLLCIELATGTEKWSQAGFGPGGVILAGDELVVLSDKGELVRAKASPERYQEVSRFKALAGKCWTTPSLSNGKFYLRSTTEAACFEVATRR